VTLDSSSLSPVLDSHLEDLVVTTDDFVECLIKTWSKSDRSVSIIEGAWVQHTVEVPEVDHRLNSRPIEF